MNKLKKSTLFVFLSAFLLLPSCSDDKERTTVRFSETDLPTTIPWYAAEYSFSVGAVSEGEIIPWSYQVKVDNQLVKEESNLTALKAEFALDNNFSAKKREVVVACNFDGVNWEVVTTHQQEEGVVKVGQNHWAKGNLTLSGDRFAIAKDPTEYGLLFKHRSIYGVKIEGKEYSGTAYTPEAKQISLDQIQSDQEDPCLLATEGMFRLPNLSELFDLYEHLDEAPISRQGVTLWGVANGSLYLPLAGVCSPEGDLSAQNQTTAYWGSSKSDEDQGAIVVISKEYSLVDYNRVGSLNSVRCVSNVEAPSYVSHTPTELKDNAAAEITVVTKPGASQSYTVALIPTYGKETPLAEATAEKPTVKLTLPQNKTIEPMEYSLYVNEEYTGQKIVQPGATSYLIYKSHQPAVESVPEDEFKLTVNTITDLEDAPIEVRGSDGYSAKKFVNNYQPTVVFTIPANQSAEARVLSIWMNGVDTGKKITQEGAKPKAFSVIWSEGYLTVKEGAYVIAQKGERGLYFKYKNPYGMEITTTPSTTGGVKYIYSGFAYHPAKVEVAFTAIPKEEVDPCSLVAPKNSWRMPTQEDVDNLVEFEHKSVDKEYIAYTDGDQEVFFYTTGMLRQTDGNFIGENFVRLWTSTPAGSDKAISITGSTKEIKAGSAADVNQGLSIRCVKDK